MSLGFHHTIKPNQKNERIRHLIVFDVESHIDKKVKDKTIFEPFLWTCIYCRYRNEQNSWIDKYYHGTAINDFWNIVEKHAYIKEKVIVSSHHLEPDFIPLQGTQQLTARGWILGKYITHNKILYFEFIKDRRKIVITNSGNIFSGSIEMWGKALGIPKLNMPTYPTLDKAWIDYCMQDTIILMHMWKSYLQFLDDNDMGNLQFTAASQAMTTYRHRFMDKTIAIHRHPETMALERLAYHGGRFQALQIGNIQAKPVWRLDINSMYGNIMQLADLPYELRGYSDNIGVDKLIWLMKKYAVIAEVTVFTDDAFIPIIVEGKVTYPTGKIECILSTPELEYILQHGSIVKAKRCSWYRKAKILKAYADYFLGLRQQYKDSGNKPYELLAKLMVNSLYGKFGQYGYKEEIIDTCNPDIIKYEESYSANTKQKIGYLFYGGKIRVVKKESAAYNTFVAIASHITAYGRVRLWQLIKQAGLVNVYHVATDSLIVNENGLANLHDELDSNTFGKLKIEEEIKSLTIKAPNDMVMDGKEKIKGINKKAGKLDDNTYVITIWPRFNTLLKRNELSFYYTKQQIKRLKRTVFNSLDALGNNVKVYSVYT